MSNMDAKAMTSLGISLVMLVLVLIMFFYGQDWFQLNDDGAINDLMGWALNSPFALAGVIGIYVLLALMGFPQILLITATVIAFGPVNGAVYSWVATMVSATVTFALGFYLGGRWVQKNNNARVQKTMRFLSRRGIIASGIVRLVPSAPFIVVNSAAGAAHIPIWKFWLGTSIGIIPKILFVAVLSTMAPDKSVLKEGVSGIWHFIQTRSLVDLGLAGLAVLVWLGFLLLMRRIYLQLRARENGE